MVISSRFNPFTYAELTAPMRDYREAYDKVEADYSDLLKLTEAWADIANRENSPEAFEMYRNYSNRLNQVTADFARGMTVGNRRALIGLKRDYAREIEPISRASAAMNAANDLRDKAGSDAIFEVGRYTSLDDFLHGKVANNKYESRKDIAARTAALTQATMLNILLDPVIKNSMSPQFLEIIQHSGGSLEDLQAAIAGNAEASNRFALIKAQMISELGGLDRFDAAGRTAIEGAINEGLYAGLDRPQVSLQQNGEYVSKYQRQSLANDAARIALGRDEFQYKKDQDQWTRDRATGVQPIAIDPDGTRHFTNGVNTWTEKPNQKKDSNGRYIYRDSTGKEWNSTLAGQTSLTYEGRTFSVTPVHDGTYTRSALTPVPVTTTKGSTTTTASDPDAGGAITGSAYGSYTLPAALRTTGNKARLTKAPVFYFDAWWDDLSHGVEFHSSRPSGINLTDAQNEVYDLEDYLQANGNGASSSAYTQIATQLRASGLKPSDMLLMKDYDSGSDSHYILVPKGYDIDGNYIGLNLSLITHERVSSSSSRKL